MSFDVSNNLNSAIVSGVLGVQRASDNIAGISFNLAQQQASLRTTSDLLSGAALQQIGNTTNLLPSGGDTLTNDLVSLTVNARNAQASANVLDVANETVGKLIDTIA